MAGQPFVEPQGGRRRDPLSRPARLRPLCRGQAEEKRARRSTPGDGAFIGPRDSRTRRDIVSERAATPRRARPFLPRRRGAGARAWDYVRMRNRDRPARGPENPRGFAAPARFVAPLGGAFFIRRDARISSGGEGLVAEERVVQLRGAAARIRLSRG